jgi:hypothetical protein
MAIQLQEVEFETRTIGPLVLTTPVLQRLEFRRIVNRYCPIAEQAELDHGLVAELITQSRLSDPSALYDLPGWAAHFAISTLYPEIERTEPVNDDPGWSAVGCAVRSAGGYVGRSRRPCCPVLCARLTSSAC